MPPQAKAQFRGEFSLGSVSSANYFLYYNKADWIKEYNFQNRVILPVYPNAFSNGLKTDYHISDKLVSSNELTYSNYKQKYIGFNGITDNIRVYLKHEYIQLGSSLLFSNKLNRTGSWFLSYGAGLRLSYSFNYLDERIYYYEYQIEPSGQWVIQFDSITNYIRYTPHKSHQVFHSFYRDTIIDLDRPLSYSRFVLGVTGDLSLNYYFRNVIKLSFGLNLFYDMTNVDYISPDIGNCLGAVDRGGKPHPSHNMGVGPKISVQYIFNPQSYFE